MSEWLPIRYRDFYDIPRAFVVEHGGRLYLFDCLFKHEEDDYESDFSIYRIPIDIAEQIDLISWTDLAHRSELVGQVSTEAVQFDGTMRAAIRREIFDHLQLLQLDGDS
jgi:hypothetical protein